MRGLGRFGVAAWYAQKRQAVSRKLEACHLELSACRLKLFFNYSSTECRHENHEFYLWRGIS
jgi:hypothetical protein